MTKSQQKDNSTFLLKTSLRRKLLKMVDSPVVMETHGGRGKIFSACYTDIERGIVFEKNEEKSAILAMQRPTWSVYECDCEMAIRANVGSCLPVNFLDCDPYGEAWPVLDAFFQSERLFTSTLAIVVNDGLRQMLKINGGWRVKSLAEIVARHGNDSLYNNYLEVCQELLKEKASQRGYALTRWAGYYCGYQEQMTHYAALLSRDAG